MPSRFVESYLKPIVDHKGESRPPLLAEAWLDFMQKWRRAVDALNAKAFSVLSTYLHTVVVGQVVVRHVVPADRNLIVVNLSAIAGTAGAGGATGITLRLAGGSATKDVNVLAVAAVSTDLGQDTLLNYEVPGGQTFTVTVQADDHAPAPEVVRLFFGVRIL